MNHKFLHIALVSVLFTISCSRDGAVAIVDGRKITASALRAEMRMEKGKYDSALLSQKPNFDEFRKAALMRLINENVFLAEAQKKGITVSKDELAGLKTARGGAIDDDMIKERGIDPKAWNEAQKRRVIIEKLIQKEVLEKIPVSDEKVLAYYNKHQQDFNRPAQFRARQILVDTRDAAEQTLAKLKGGADFAEMAKEYSLSPDGRRGGDIGFFDSRMYPEIFSVVCQQLKAGELSDVVQTDYGFQIFELLEKRPAYQVPFEEAKEAIRQLLREEKAEGLVDKWSSDLVGRAKITVNEEAVKGVMLD